MLEDGHYLNGFGLRQIRQALECMPERAPVTVDFGWLKRVDERLLDELARLPGAERITFEAAHWAVALEGADRLHALLTDDPEAWEALAKYDTWGMAG